MLLHYFNQQRTYLKVSNSHVVLYKGYPETVEILKGGYHMTKTKVWLFLSIILALGMIVACGGGDECDPEEIRNAELEVGDEAPDFRLPDHKGGYVRLSDFEGASNVVIAFFPAAFTPV
jgi:hypothetical protein